MSAEVLTEEFEVLESIYPTELSIVSDREIQIDVEPDEAIDGEHPLQTTAIPIEGELEDAERETLLESLTEVGEENIGMAMTFTLVSHLREQMASLVRKRADQLLAEETEKERVAIEAEEARTRGTPVTVESFKAWKIKFAREMAQKKAKDEEERLRALSPKEREEWKRAATRPTGRQLFEKNKNLEHDDDSFVEEGTVSVDISQYDRSQLRADEDEDDDGVHFSDSD
ncbi:RWD-domain-containing protein [Suillus subalutaceus]|uniref:RWD-domain-containing protein n=1 Tax=Suillus subalutaceus TaxID=48586 RepID=UPI001B867D17|nr:RWD-domain-containing protein [Suillus subalutaceus]KAG1853700.1 RWD-domain-containing protein [Suillus subalutaceus]